MPRLSNDDLARRRLGIGSSDVAQILGISPYENAGPMAVYVDKLGLDADSSDDDGDDTADTFSDELELGHELEWPLIQYYARKNRLDVRPGGTVQHVAHEWMFANVDGVATDAAGDLMVEAKCVGFSHFRDWDTKADDGIPNYVRVQVAWQMACRNVDRAHVVAMIGGPAGFHVFEVLRDLELEAMLIERCGEFWRDVVVARKPPELDNTQPTRALLDAKYPAPKAEPVEVAAPEDMDVIAEKRIASAHAEELGKAEKRTCDALLMEALGKDGATRMRGAGWKFSWSTTKAGKRRTLFQDLEKAARVRITASAVQGGEL